MTCELATQASVSRAEVAESCLDYHSISQFYGEIPIKMTSWTLYILECNDRSLYTGITTNLKKRLKCHNEKRASKYTRSRLPCKVVHAEIFDEESLARKREAEIKGLSRKRKLELVAENPC